MKSRQLAGIHPGEILQEEFLKPMAITQYRLAKDIGGERVYFSHFGWESKLAKLDHDAPGTP